MVILSTLRPLVQRTIICNVNNVKTIVPYREMGGHGHKVFPLTPTRWQWYKFKDYVHLYLMIGLIPVTIIILSANILIGPATLTPIPEGYTPKYWEYYKHPITRWLAKNIFQNPQQEYEKYMHHIFEEDEKRKLRGLEKAVKAKIAERRDFQAYYYKPNILAKYIRKSKEGKEYLDDIMGD